MKKVIFIECSWTETYNGDKMDICQRLYVKIQIWHGVISKEVLDIEAKHL